MKESQEQCCLFHESVTVNIRDNPPPPCFLTSVLGNIFTWRHRDATQCVKSCLIHKKIFRSQFNFIKFYIIRLLKDIELALFFLRFEPKWVTLWVFNKKKTISKIGVPFHHINLKSHRIYYYYLSQFLTLHIFRHSKIFRNDKHNSVCTLLNPFYFVCRLFIWTVKIVCWIRT